MSPYPPVDERPALLTPDEYMTLLVERAREADEQSRAALAAAGHDVRVIRPSDLLGGKVQALMEEIR